MRLTAFGRLIAVRTLKCTICAALLVTVLLDAFWFACLVGWLLGKLPYA